MPMTRTDNEIDDVLNDAADWEDAGRTDVPGMTYEQGVTAALRWVRGESDESPIETRLEDS